MNKHDILIRAVKTFIQAFFGTLVTELAALSAHDFDDIQLGWKIALPFIIPALSAGASAVWNTLMPTKPVDDDGNDANF